MNENYGMIRAAAAVPELEVAHVEKNCIHIISLLSTCKERGADLVVFPELSLTGYSCGDLFFTKTLLTAAEKGLAQILESTKDLNTILVVGLPVYDGVCLYNCAAVLKNGLLLGVVPKTFMPNYGEFYEGRWFASAEESPLSHITLCDQKVPFGSRLIFDFGLMKLAVEICEDLWVSTPPSVNHALYGANVICNLSASNAVIGKSDYRRLLVKQRSFTSHCGYIFASAGIGESTTDTLYCGHTIIGENGTLLLDEVQNDFSSKILFTEIDLERLEADRKKINTFGTFEKTNKEYRYISTPHCYQKFTSLTRTIARQPFVPSGNKGKDARLSEIYDILALSLAKRLRHTKITTPVIGISGGLDSTLALLITVRAMDILSLPRSGVLAVTMPGFGTTGRTLKNAKELMNQLGVTALEISIRESCLLHFKDIGQDPNNTDVTYENAQARERTQILMDLANQRGGLVIGTGDLSEAALGWSTYGGDHISMYAVNSGVPKTLVRHLVSWIGNQILKGEALKTILDILDTPVSPELLPADGQGKIAQKTEEIIGDYVLHDFFLYYFIRFGFSPKKILFLAQQAFMGEYDADQIKTCLKLFFKRFFANQFKRSCTPDGPKIGSITLSPRADWRMPSDAAVDLWLEELN